MKKHYFTPLTSVAELRYERNLLYSGLKDMDNQDIYPEDELDDDDL